MLILMGMAQLLSARLEKEVWGVYGEKISLICSALAIIFFAVVKEPYVLVLLFLLFLGKLFLLSGQKRIK